MASTAGTADLVSSFTQGQRIEDAAYDAAMKRMLAAETAQATLAKRMQEAAGLERENEAAEALPRLVASVFTGRENPNAPLTANEMAALMNAYTGAGHTLTDTTSGLKNTIGNLLQRGAFEALGQENVTPYNQAAFTYKMDPMQTVQKVGDLFLEGAYGAPKVNQGFTDANAAAGAEADKSGNKGLREKKIQDAMQLYNMDRPTAVAFVDKYVSQDINEFTGNVVRQNILPPGSISLPDYGPATEIPIEGGTSAVPPPAPPPGESLYELAPEATGLGPSAQDLLARTVTLLGGSADMTPTTAIQTMNTAVQNMVRALAVNPRFPVAEQERILREINIRPGWFTSEETLRSRMNSLRGSLELRAQQAERDAADPGLSRDVRKAQSDNAVMIRNFLPRLGPPQQQMQITPQQRAQAEAQLMDVPGFIDELTPDEREEMIILYVQQRMQ